MPARSHGGSQTKLYRVWWDMIRRCRLPTDPAFPYYGARGILVCDRWKDFANFAQDMGERPEGGTLERINNSKGYEPGNCRWASRSEQVKNRRMPARNRTGCAGVEMTKHGRFHAAVGVNGKKVHLGTFATLGEAAEARRKALREHGFGEKHGEPA